MAKTSVNKTYVTFLKNFKVSFPFSSIKSGRFPVISTMRHIWLWSDTPGNIGSPRNNSTEMQPSDQMSIAPSYGRPSRTWHTKPNQTKRCGGSTREGIVWNQGRVAGDLRAERVRYEATTAFMVD